MTLDNRARRAAQGIRRAVEVMEMSTSTKEPRKVERFDRFRYRKQRNRRVGAFLVAAILTIATIVVATIALDHRDTTIPATVHQNGRIVFGAQDRDGQTRVYTLNPDGTDVRPLLVSGYVTESDGSVQPITGSTPVKSECMSWAPDGSKLLIDHQSIGGVAEGTGLATINPDGTGYTKLPITNIPQEIACGALSPDDTRVITSSGPGHGFSTARASDGGDLVRLTNRAGMYPSYSPNGAQVVFTSAHDRASQLSHHASGLWVVNADGTGLHRAANLYAIRPSWSPDGQSILFSSVNDNSFYVVRADGTGLQRITPESVPRLRAAIYPSWSPDGTSFVFVGVSGSNQNLFTARIDGTDVEQITHTSGVSYVSPDWGTDAG